MSTFWTEYRKNSETSIAQKLADAKAGITRCAHPDCNAPVAGRERKYGHHAAPRYCVDHTPTGGWEARRRDPAVQEKANQRKKEWREREKARQSAVLERMGEAS
jgi:hypothetical protein